MITDNAQFEQFIRSHRWAVLTTLRRSGAPVNSVVAYACDGDDLIVSTPGYTLKKRTIERDRRVSLCVLTNSEPFNFVQIEGHATVEREDLERRTLLVFAAIADTGYQPPADLAGWLKTQQRVIVRIQAERVTGVIR